MIIPKELEKPYCILERVSPTESINIETGTIDVSKLEECEFYNFCGNTVDVDKKLAQELYAELQLKHGEKVTLEASCVCDSTPVFAIQLMELLARIGATNIKIRSEEVENPVPTRMKTRYIATGIIWNTNNFRKLHGVPMKRRKHGRYE